MCRNIKTLFNFEPPATEDELRASSLQFVRKLSGFAKPSRAKQEAFDKAADQVADVARERISSRYERGAAEPGAGAREGAGTRRAALRRRRLKPGASPLLRDPLVHYAETKAETKGYVMSFIQ